LYFGRRPDERAAPRPKPVSGEHFQKIRERRDFTSKLSPGAFPSIQPQKTDAFSFDFDGFAGHEVGW
jgi:hypothetical protein